MCLKTNLMEEKCEQEQENVKRQIEYVKSVNIAKIVAIKGYGNCIELVSNKLDVSENDLCKNCKRILTEI